MAREGYTRETLKRTYPDVYKAMMETKGDKAPEGYYNTYMNFFRNYTTADKEPRKVSLQAVLDYLNACGKRFSITIK